MRYSLAQILSVATGVLFCDSREVQSFLSEISGHDFLTHDIPRIGSAIAPHLCAQLPFLKDIDVSEVNRRNVLDVLAALEEKYGAFHDVTPISSRAIVEMSPEESLKFAGLDGKVIKIRQA